VRRDIEKKNERGGVDDQVPPGENRRKRLAAAVEALFREPPVESRSGKGDRGEKLMARIMQLGQKEKTKKRKRKVLHAQKKEKKIV